MKSVSNPQGWLDDMIWCVERIPTEIFSLGDAYRFEKILSERHPENNNVRAKIRQQLQRLRDEGYIAFLGNGTYQKR